MNLNHLAIFHAVAESGSISRGADRLMVSQPAVSKQLGLFERALGVSLFERLPRGVRLTNAGTTLAEYARQIFALEERGKLAMEALRDGSIGRVRVGASTTIAVYLLPEAIVAFAQLHPGVQVELEVGRSVEIARAVEAGALDAAFVEVRPGSEKLATEAFRNDELVAVSAPTNRLVGKRTISTAQLVDEPFVVRNTGSDTKSFVERELALRGLTVKAVMSVGSTEAMKRAVAAGVGVGIVSRLSVELEVEAGRLAILRVDGLQLERPFYRVVRREMPGVAALDAFCTLLQRPIMKAKVGRPAGISPKIPR